jgi:hypothetical protein
MSRETHPVEGGDAAGEVAASELYRRMPEGGAIGGSQTEYVAETVEPTPSASDWVVDGDGE